MKKIIQKVLAAVLIAATVTSMGAVGSAATSKSSGLYDPIPYMSNQQLTRETVKKVPLWADANTLTVYGCVGISAIKNEICAPGQIDVYDSNTKKYMQYECLGISGKEVGFTFKLDSYYHGTRYWIKPNTYKVRIIFKLKNAKKYIHYTFSFKVYERGFKK